MCVYIYIYIYICITGPMHVQLDVGGCEPLDRIAASGYRHAC